MRIAVFLCLLLLHTPALADTLHESRLLMGTTLEMTLCGPAASRSVLNEAFDIVDRLEQSLSNYRDDSEVSVLNREASSKPVKVSKQLLKMLNEAKSLSLATSGKFDVTVGALMTLWSRAERDGFPPKSESIALTKLQVGFNDLSLNEKDSTVQFLKKGISVDTGGIGKGYAVDMVVNFLRAAKVDCALISFGTSSTFALGSPPDSEYWNLEVNFPSLKGKRTISLKNKALSASDSFGTTYQIGGKVYGKLIDPDSGMAAKKSIQAVVVSDSATVAEGLSKAIILLPNPRQIDGKAVGHYEYLRIEDAQFLQSDNFPFRKG